MKNQREPRMNKSQILKNKIEGGVNMKKAAIYCRYAGENNLESLNQQITACRNFAENNHYTIVDEYYDPCHADDIRLEFQRMISDSKQHKFKTIIIYQYDRFSRNFHYFSYYKDLLKKNGVSLVFVSDTNTPDEQSELTKHMLIEFKEFWNMELSRKIKEGIRRSKERQAMLEQADTKNPDQQQSSKKKTHD